jgi:hypothetical protein
LGDLVAQQLLILTRRAICSWMLPTSRLSASRADPNVP